MKPKVIDWNVKPDGSGWLLAVFEDVVVPADDNLVPDVGGAVKVFFKDFKPVLSWFFTPERLFYCYKDGKYEIDSIGGAWIHVYEDKLDSDLEAILKKSFKELFDHYYGTKTEKQS